MNAILEKLKSMGALRNLLHASAVISTLLLPFARTIDYSDDWSLFFAGILPAISPIIVILIGLDTMMSSIWRADAEGDPDEVDHVTALCKKSR